MPWIDTWADDGSDQFVDLPPVEDYEFEFTGPYGTLFRSMTPDIVHGIEVEKTRPLSNAEFAADVAAMVQHHTTHAQPGLQNRTNWDCVQFLVRM